MNVCGMVMVVLLVVGVGRLVIVGVFSSEVLLVFS